jgi:excisionase family DNA binding protein
MDPLTMSSSPINWTAVIRDLDDRALDDLAERLAPRLAPKMAEIPTVDQRNRARSWMTVAEAATATRLHPQTVYRHLRNGRLQGDRAGSQWRIAQDALDDYLSNGAPNQTSRGTAPSRRPVAARRPGPLRALLDAEREAG